MRRIPESTLKLLLDTLHSLGLNELSKSVLKEAILELSNHYQISDELRRTPWDYRETSLAYMLYFFPLNYLRCQAVLDRAQQSGLKLDARSLHCLGSGPGTEYFAWKDFGLQAEEYHFIEKHPKARDLHKTMLKEGNFTWSETLDPPKNPGSVLFSSFSLNEIEDLPLNAFKFQTLIFLDASTRKIGRKLLKTRRRLLESGYHMWAPCTHQGNCPLLEHSKDWCHDRSFIKIPEELYEFHKNLPMENRSLTYSYLIASKQAPPASLNKYARVIGDTLKEKGKIRQMVCRGPEREFLSWLKRSGKPQFIPRGSLVALNQSFEKKASELRVNKPLEIHCVEPDQ